MKKGLGGIFSCVPIITFVLFLSLFLNFFKGKDMDAVLNDAEMAYMTFLMIGLCIAVISTFAVMIWFMIRIHKSMNFTERQKVVWYLLLYFGNMFVYPGFWYLYVHKRIDEKFPFYPYRNKLWW